MRRLGFTGPWLAVLVVGLAAAGFGMWKLQQWGAKAGGQPGIMLYGRHPVVVAELGPLKSSVMNQTAMVVHPDYSEFSLSNPVVYDVAGPSGRLGQIVAVMGFGSNPFADAKLLVDDRERPLKNPDSIPLRELVVLLGTIEMRDGHLERGLTQGAARVPIPAVSADRDPQAIETEMEAMLQLIDEAEEAGTTFGSFRLDPDAPLGFAPDRGSEREPTPAQVLTQDPAHQDPAQDPAEDFLRDSAQDAVDRIRQQADADAAVILQDLKAAEAQIMATELERLEAEEAAEGAGEEAAEASDAAGETPAPQPAGR